MSTLVVVVAACMLLCPAQAQQEQSRSYIDVECVAPEGGLAFLQHRHVIHEVSSLDEDMSEEYENTEEQEQAEEQEHEENAAKENNMQGEAGMKRRRRGPPPADRRSKPCPTPSGPSKPSDGPAPAPAPAPMSAAAFFPPTPAGQEEIFGDYFDIVAGSPTGSWVTGRLNPKANRIGSLPDWEFSLTRDVDNVFEIVNQQDSVSRLFGALRVRRGATVGPARTVHKLTAELRRKADGQVMGKLDFKIQAVEKTVLKQMESKVRAFALSESHCYGRTQPSDSVAERCSGASYSKTTGAWDSATKPIGGLGWALAQGTSSKPSQIQSCILDRCDKLSRTVPIDKSDMLSASKLAELDNPNKYMPGEGFADFTNNGLTHNKVTHQWELTDALVLPGIEVAEEAFLAALTQGPNSEASLGLDGLYRLISVNFAINPLRRRIGAHERWGNLMDVNHSTGLWSDANLAHRLRTWVGMMYIWQDYNRPATYIPYWYDDFDFSRFVWWSGKKLTQDEIPANFSFVRGFPSPRGVIGDIKAILSNAYAKPHKYALSGFNPDGFIAHHQDYCHDTAMTAYGFEWLSRPLKVASIVKGTPWAFEPEWVMTAARYLAYSYSRICYKGQIDWLFAGRNYFFYGNWRWRSTLMVPTVRLLIDELGSAISKPLLEELEVLAATNDGPEALGNTAFWNSDTMVHRKSGWYMSLRMRSIRTTGNEDFEKTGKSWHSGSGVLLARVHGDEYDVVRTSMDWHLLPGITEEWRTDSLPKKGSRCGGNTFATMASDGDLGVAAFVYQPAPTDPYSSASAKKSFFFLESGAVMLGNSITRATVDGKQRGGQGQPIVTVVEQALWRSDITYQVGAKGKVQTLPHGGGGCDTSVQIPAGEIAWLHQGSVGYVIKSPTDAQGGTLLQLKCGSEISATDKGSSSWGKEVRRQEGKYFGSHQAFLAVLNHGNQPEASSYSYAVLPGLSASDIAGKAFSFFGPQGAVVVLNTPDVQAVIDKRASMVQAAFFESGKSLELPFVFAGSQKVNVVADRPGTMYMRRVENLWVLSAAEGTKDPKAKTMTLTFSSAGLFASSTLGYTLPGVSPRGAVDHVVVEELLGESKVIFGLPDIDDDAAYDFQSEMYLGVPITVKIAKKGHPTPALALTTREPAQSTSQQPPIEAPALSTTDAPPVPAQPTTSAPAQSTSQHSPTQAPVSPPCSKMNKAIREKLLVQVEAIQDVASELERIAQ